MASSSTQPGTASRKSILIPVMTLEGHKPVASLLPDGNSKHTKMNHVSSICYFPDGEQLISGSDDKTTRRWDLQARKEIKEARDVREHEVCAVGVSRDGRWIVTAEGAFGSRRGELRVCEVETGIVKSFSEGHIGTFSFDISLDSTLLASSSSDGTVWIKSLKTGNMVAQFSNPSSYGPICSQAVGAIRLSQDSKKLAMKSAVAQSLEVWDLQAETCVRLGAVRSSCGIMTNAPMFWTAQDKTIITAFSFNSSNDVSTSDLKTIYEFDASTLKKVGVPFKGHTELVTGLALSFDCALLASAANDFTIKLWAFESRQLLASFVVQHPCSIIFSPDSRQLVYTAWAKIHICDISFDVLSSILPVQQKPRVCISRKQNYPLHANILLQTSASAAATPRLADLHNVHDPYSYPPLHQISSLQSDETPSTVRRRSKPMILPDRSFSPQSLRQSPTIHRLRSTFFRYLRKLLPSSSRMEVPLQNTDLSDSSDVCSCRVSFALDSTVSLQFPATLPLPPNSSQATTNGLSQTDPRKIVSVNDHCRISNLHLFLVSTTHPPIICYCSNLQSPPTPPMDNLCISANFRRSSCPSSTGMPNSFFLAVVKVSHSFAAQ
jgi:hypothetical protein